MSSESGAVRTVLKFQPRARKEPKSVESGWRPASRLSRLMALAIKFEDMLALGEVEGYSELSRIHGVDRGRISRIMQLRLLAPDLQERLLELGEAERDLSLKHVIPVCRIACWRKQRVAFERIRKRVL